MKLATRQFVTRVTSLICGALIITVSHIAYADKAPQSFQQCVACHGDKGQGNPQLNAPVIAGLSASYTTRQLKHFATGIRGNKPADSFGQQMVAVSQQLDFEQEVPALSQYLAKLSPQTTQTSSGDLMNGSRYFQAKCGACHGGQAQGNEAFNAPKLAGQNLAYLKRQMNNFVSGVRGSHAEDKLGRQMAMMAKTTTGKELDDILHYIATQSK
ncbi:c-type cytochrome [Thalassotalea sp. G2M2-11]|uniref:c-type cytochrome n=1 Tax=Thalassotalea sp. G2M2-11 TaxID=2787627 RepID=UPI0019CFACCE|nr:c-type cytochrome [Thalassotalea sp. G2M2-11]